MEKERYITLKEASEISGYAPDYVGQLIRKGRLSGKQVYSGVAWVTTEKALRQYLSGGGGPESQAFTRLIRGLGGAKSGDQPSPLFRILLYAVVGAGIAIIVVLFYILSVNIEYKLEERGVKQIEAIKSGMRQ